MVFIVSVIFFVIFQYQPTKQKIKRKADFDPKFKFVSSVEEYNKVKTIYLYIKKVNLLITIKKLLKQVFILCQKILYFLYAILWYIFLINIKKNTQFFLNANFLFFIYSIKFIGPMG